MKIKFTVDHNITGFSNKAFLIGDYEGIRFVETFYSNSWLNLSLRLAKYLIKQRFKIIFNERL